MIRCTMAKPRKVEIALASVGLLFVGLIGHWALSRTGERAPTELYYAPARDAGADRAHRSGKAAPLLPGDAPASAAHVAGRVHDLLTGEAVAGVTVALVPAGGSAEITAESGADGRYELWLAPGRYRLRAVGEDVIALDTAVAGSDGEAAVALLAGAAGDPSATWIELAAGSRARDFDIPVVRLARVHGRVVDGNGEPLGKVLVRHRTSLLDRVLDSAHTAPTGEAWTESHGVFAVRVPPGAVTLIATADLRTPSRTHIHWVAPGAELRGVEIVMDEGAEIAGQVVDARGAPVPGARVAAQVADAAEPVTAVADGSGGFRLRALPPGRAVLEASAAGHAPSPPVMVTVSEIPGAARDDVVLGLGAPAALSGRVVEAGGPGVHGAVVRAVRPMSELALPVAITDEHGAFALADLPPGPLGLQVSAPGFAPGRLSGIEVPAEDVDIALVPGGVVTGVVTAGGEPLAHFAVSLIRRAELDGTGVDDGGPWMQTARVVSADGSYRVGDLAPGRYTVAASAPGLAPVERAGITVEPGREVRVDIALAPGAQVSGTVRDARSGAAVAGAAVRLSTGSASPMTYTDASGGFAIADIAPGRRSLEVSHPAYVGRVEPGIELAAGGHEQVDVTLEPVPLGSDRTIEIAGIGAILQMDGERLMVQDLVPHGPAEVAGVLPGDEVFAIDGEATGGRGFGDCIEAIRGVAGTVVRLGLHRGDDEHDLDVVRGTVRVQPGGD